MHIFQWSSLCRHHHKGMLTFSAYPAFGIMTYPCICIKCNITRGKKDAICYFCWNQNDKATTDVFKTTFLFPLSCEVIQTSPTFWFNYLQFKAATSSVTPLTLGSFCFPSFRESRNFFTVVFLKLRALRQQASYLTNSTCTQSTAACPCYSQEPQYEIQIFRTHCRLRTATAAFLLLICTNIFLPDFILIWRQQVVTLF